MNKQAINTHIDKLNEIPSEVNKILNSIRELDIKVLSYTVQVQRKREQVLEKLSSSEEIRSAKEKNSIKGSIEEIEKLQSLQIELTKQKIALAEELYNVIDEPTEILDQEIALNYPELNQSEGLPQKGRNSKRHKQENQWQYDAFEPYYCYCERPSFGSMVMCQNPFCSIGWFHMECIDEKVNSGDKWFCKNCKKIRTKGRSKKEEK